jgi:CRP-like cAMP-binding protein
MRLMERNPKERLSAYEMLHHPWVTGEAASTNVIVGSDKRLNKFKRFKTKLQTQFFADAVGWADEAIAGETRRRTSLIERSFKAFDDGSFLLQKLVPLNRGVLASEVVVVDHDDDSDADNDENAKLGFTEYSNLLAENMKQKYFPRGHVVYRQGTEGNHMYFINSGTVEIITEDGVTNDRHQGDFFGEGALLHPKKIRSCTVKCKTPVHVIEINRDYFEKYLASSSGLVLSLREKDKIRRRNRAKALLKLQNGMKSETFKRGETYKEGDPGDSLFIVENGVVDVSTQGHQVLKATEGNFCGEHSLLTGRMRNTTATCISDECVALRMLGRDFRQLMDAAPHVKESLTDMMNRRDFKKAVVLRLGHEFPYDDPRKAFNSVDIKKRGYLLRNEVSHIMRSMDTDYTDQEIDAMMNTLDLSGDGKVSYDEFVKVFIGDIRATQSM